MGGKFYQNVVKMQKRMTGNQCMKALGVSTLDNIGKFSWSAIQAAPSFSSSFPHMFGEDSNNFCLIPCAIDQDVYFRITRGIAPRLGFEKPAVIHSSFLPAMGGPSSKMSSSTGKYQPPLHFSPVFGGLIRGTLMVVLCPLAHLRNAALHHCPFERR